MHMDLHLARHVARLPHNHPRDAWAVACDILAASGLVNDAQRAKRLSKLLDDAREADARRALRTRLMHDTGLVVDYHEPAPRWRIAIAALAAAALIAITAPRWRMAIAAVATAALIAITAIGLAHAALSAPAVITGTLAQADALRGW